MSVLWIEILSQYGISYMGSKDKICDLLMRILPNGENFYDLFGGGFAVTHAAIAHKKFKSYFFNEIQPGNVELIEKAIGGDFNYKVFKPEFITREMFFERKDTDPYVRIVWSFGNGKPCYLFGKDIEKEKESLHNAVIFCRFDSLAKEILGFDKWPEGFTHPTNRRLYFPQTIRKKRKSLGLRDDPQARQLQRLQQLQQLQQLERLQRLEQLERLQRLEQLEQLERLQPLERLEQLEQLEQLELTALDYREVKIKPNSIVYCDPPYAGTAKYVGEFDHKAFYKWALESKHPIFISEYAMPKEFVQIANLSKRAMLSAKKSVKGAAEKVFINPAAFKMFIENKEVNRVFPQRNNGARN